jgi:hypothetical protein
MKKVILFTLVLAVCSVLHSSVLAQQYPDDSSGANVAIYPEDYEGFPRYLIPYIRSQTGQGIRSATAVTVVNQSTTSCSVQVEWFTPSGASLCTVASNLAAGAVREFCSRSLPISITGCIVPCTPPLNNLVLGKAIVSSTEGFTCSLIGVDARVYYTTGAGDTAVSAISNSKVVFIGEGNLGD